MHVTLSCGVPKIRHITALINAGVGHDYNVHSNDIHVLERAILERIFFVKTPNGFAPPPKPKPRAFTKRLKSFSAMMHTLSVSLTPMTYENFVLSYVGRKRRVYERAVASLLVTDWSSKDARVKAFVKVEKHNLTLKPDPAPRVIQPRDPRYNVSVGIYIKPLEGLVYEAIGDIFGHPTVMKGMTVIDVGRYMREKWDMFDNPVAIGLDASRFDQHVSEQALRWEHSVYKHYFPWSKEFAALLNLQLHNFGTGYTPNGRLRYNIKGCRMSGDMNTGLGNSLLMCAMVHAYFDSIAVRVQLANNGDDCVVFLEQRDLSKLSTLPQWFTEMGFTMVVEQPVDVFEQIEFCQMQPVNTGYDWIMVRKPACALGKDIITYNSVQTEKDWTFYCQAVSDCGSALYGHLPVFSGFYPSLDRKRVVKYKGNPNLTGGLFYWDAPTDKRVDETTVRYSFYLAFDITPDEQIAIERYYSITNHRWSQSDPDKPDFKAPPPIQDNLINIHSQVLSHLV